jgi:hypothetical protein
VTVSRTSYTVNVSLTTRYDIGVSERIVTVGRKLLTAARAAESDSSYLKQIFGLLCDELHVLEKSSRQEHLLLISATFVAFYARLTKNGRSVNPR